MNTHSYTLEEIQSQPEAWDEAVQVASKQSKALGELWHSRHYDQVVFTGCGSTYYLSLAAAALLQQFTGVPAWGVPAGELLLYPDTVFPRSGENLLVAISRSGTTTETIRALQAFRQAAGGNALVITSHPESTLAGLGDLVLGLPGGQERSVAQTRSFASMYVAAAALAAILGEREHLLAEMAHLPAVGERLLAGYHDLAAELGGDLERDRFYFLGSGPRYGLACEANLKMKEMTLTHSEPFHFLEFRHGPMSMVTGSAVVIGLLSDANRVHEQAVIDEMAELGGKTLALAESGADVAFESGLPEAIRNVLYLPVLQLMAYYRATAKGLDPDHPKNLTAVVELDI
jgi:glucosamine--fructose-6-phosphate aminotransferase (isomerizing)